MRQFQTAVVERKERYDGAFATHPFECAWASEAIVFLRIEALEEGTGVDARVQISADGIRWLDEGTRFETVRETGDGFVRVRHFGGWLRLAGEVTRADGAPAPAGATLTVQLALKE